MSQGGLGAQQLLVKVRSLVQQYTAKQLYSTAVYWAEKAYTLSNGDPNDLAAYIQALYQCKEYQRATHIIHNSPHLSHSSALKYLAARCHAACEEWEEVLFLLSPPTDLPDHTPPATPTPGCTIPDTEDLPIFSLGNVESAVLVLKGNAHEQLGDLPSAVTCYKEAVSKDVHCMEALERLAIQHMLSAEEERSLVKGLPLKGQCSSQLEADMVHCLHLQHMHHFRGGVGTTALPPAAAVGGAEGGASSLAPHIAPQLPADLQPLASSVDVLSSVASSHFKRLDLEACYQLTSALLEHDPYHPRTLLLHVACCVHMNKYELLFSLGHTLVNSAPCSALSWYVVACYYMSISKHQSARKYFTKAVSLESNFGHAHMAFGLSFAAEAEHDQAISAFSTAARIMRGSHLPLLYLGKEYHLTGCVATSIKFMKSAFDLCPHDPCLLQEIGYMIASTGAYSKAEGYFKQAIARLQAVDQHLTLPAWEPVYSNLGHVLRKQGRLEEALQAHHKALQLQPSNPSTLTALAFVHMLREDYDRTVEFAHESLKQRREDQFTVELLHTAMAELSERPFVATLPDMGPLRDMEQEVKIMLSPGSIRGRPAQAVQEEADMSTE